MLRIPHRLLVGNAIVFALTLAVVRPYTDALSQQPPLEWNTFMGSSFGNQGIAVDSSGNVYVVGSSDTEWGTDPIVTHSGGLDAYVVKLDVDGERVWITYLGGTGDDHGIGVGVDSNANVYVAGNSSATWGGTPKVAYAGSGDAFVAKLNSSGAFQWNTFAGASGFSDPVYAMVVDASGNSFIAGQSGDTWGDPEAIFGCNYCAYAAEIDKDGVRQWNTFLGGPTSNAAEDIAVDSAGNVYLTGWSDDTWGTSPGPVNPHGGSTEAFAAKLDSSGARTWNTFMGSVAETDEGRGVALDDDGNVFVTGKSRGTWGSPRSSFNGTEDDVFVIKLDNSGNRLWNTFMGSADEDAGTAIAAGSDGAVFVTGSSAAKWGSGSSSFSGSEENDTFVAKLSGGGSRLWNTFFGSSDIDYGDGIVADGEGYIYLTGQSYESWGDSPVDTHSGSNWRDFAAKIADIDIDCLFYIIPTTGSGVIINCI